MNTLKIAELADIDASLCGGVGVGHKRANHHIDYCLMHMIINNM